MQLLLGDDVRNPDILELVTNEGGPPNCYRADSMSYLVRSRVPLGKNGFSQVSLRVLGSVRLGTHKEVLEGSLD